MVVHFIALGIIFPIPPLNRKSIVLISAQATQQARGEGVRRLKRGLQLVYSLMIGKFSISIENNSTSGNYFATKMKTKTSKIAFNKT